MRFKMDKAKILPTIRSALQGPHMLAFLPALCLASYWGGGETFLILCALLTPLFYASTGGFSRGTDAEHSIAEAHLRPDVIAQEFLETAQHNGQTTACFQLGLSGLDEISRSFGDTAADEARQQIRARLASSLRDSDHVFQTGDARFVILIAPGFRLKLESLLDLGNRLRTLTEEPISVSETTQYLSLAIGIASSLNFGRNVTAETWLNSASQALNEASIAGHSTTRVWSDKLSRQFQTRRTMRDELKSAISKGQIQAHFQPQVSVHSGLVTGMEALARWDHPSRGVLAPAEFLQSMDDGGQMDQLGVTMLAQGLSALQQWDSAGFNVPTISINFSATELRNPSFPDHIKWELDRTGVLPHRLVIEVLESVIADETDDMIQRNLTSLSDLGCGIDLDDFGTGHASITTLRTFPIQRIKIDQSFVKHANSDPEKLRMLKAILSMADQLSLETLAEGVESLEEHGVLRDIQCVHAQGFLFAHPMSASATLNWLAENQLHSPNEIGASILSIQ